MIKIRQKVRKYVYFLNRLFLSVDECKEKWKNIRTVFARRFRPTPRSSGPKKSYYLADYLQFSIPFINASKPSRDNLPELPEVETILQEQDSEDDNNSEEVSTRRPTLPPRPHSVLVTPPSSYSVHGGDKETDVSFGKQKRKINEKQKAKLFEDEKTIAADFSVKKYKIDSEPIAESVGLVKDKKEEGLKMFLLSLLPDLTQFSDSQVRTFKRKVLAVVDEIAEPLPTSSPVGTSAASCSGNT